VPKWFGSSISEWLFCYQSRKYRDNDINRPSFIILTIIKPLQKTFHSRTQSPWFESGFFYFESGFSKVKSGFSQRRVRIFFRTGSGFFLSPDFLRVRVRSGFRSMPFPRTFPAKPDVEFCFLSAMPNRKSNFGFWVPCRMTISIMTVSRRMKVEYHNIEYHNSIIELHKCNFHWHNWIYEFWRISHLIVLVYTSVSY
jgi:hypothetical protein